ncbi:MAG: MlaE family ABC transporter permease [Isosphaeraceae bacterium]
MSVGLVTWFQTHRLLVANGAEAVLPSFLAVAVVVELGPVLAGLLVAGRMGAGLAAELGSMILNEEIEARTVLGADPVPSLVAPRAIACALAVPLLTVIIDISALLGALAAELTAGKLSPELFWHDSLTFLQLSDVILATLKTAVFGLLVGIVGCWTGLNADRSTEAVGRAATRGVVRSTLAVFAANAILVPCIQLATEALGWRSL